jgi:HK97 gp10 family phage protein
MVEGIEQMRRRLVTELPKRVRLALEAAMIASADRIVAGARLRVPVDEGEVRDSIRHHGVKEGKRGGLYIAVTAGDTSTLSDEKGKRYQVARLLEFGTVKMAAQPYMLPSYHANRASARRRMRRAITDAIMRK